MLNQQHNIKEHFTDDRSQIGSHEFKEVQTCTSVRRSPGPEAEKTEPVYDVIKMLGAAITYLQDKTQARQETTDKKLEV